MSSLSTTSGDQLYTQTCNAVHSLESLPQNDTHEIDYKVEYLKTQVIISDRNKYLKSATEVGNKLIASINQLKEYNATLHAEKEALRKTLESYEKYIKTTADEKASLEQKLCLSKHNNSELVEDLVYVISHNEAIGAEFQQLKNNVSQKISETASIDENKSKTILARLLLLSVDDETIHDTGGSTSFQSPEIFALAPSPTNSFNTCTLSTFSELRDDNFTKRNVTASTPSSIFMANVSSSSIINEIIKTELGKAYSVNNFDANVNLFQSRYYRRNKKREKLLVRVKELEAIVNDISSDKDAIEMELIETRNQLDLLICYMEKANNLPRAIE